MTFMKTFAALALAALTGCFPWEERQYTPAVNPVTPTDVAGMATAGYSDAMILDLIRANGVLRRPTADDVVAMKGAGASDPVIAATLQAPLTVARPAAEIHHYHHDPYWYWPSSHVSLGFSYGYWGGGYRRCR